MVPEPSSVISHLDRIHFKHEQDKAIHHKILFFSPDLTVQTPVYHFFGKDF